MLYNVPIFLLFFQVSSVKEQLDESERRNRAFEMDLQALREKVDKARIDSLQATNTNLSIIDIH